MTQIFFSPDLDGNSKQIYYYKNNSTKIVIARVIGLRDRHCERVIFPGEKFIFEATNNCQLQISQQTEIGIIEDVIFCLQLKNESESKVEVGFV
ncbi:MAG TPA: DUF1830 domain-containing protein [Xenococcaceae cyanobacterium]